VTRRILTTALATGLAAAPALALVSSPAATPQEAVDVIKKVLKRTEKACGTDWARIDAVGYEGAWKVEVRIRDSEAGRGLARWAIGAAAPRPRNALAKALARGCPAV
jgi:hypothetical protein